MLLLLLHYLMLLKGNFDKAVETYTKVLELDNSFGSALSNRAVCYLAKNEPLNCIEDCTALLAKLASEESVASSNPVLSLMPSIPPHKTQQRRKWQVLALVRRATAYRQTKNVESAKMDLEEVTHACIYMHTHKLSFGTSFLDENQH
jgi:tetratricopeptide (TPR) repeat protein